MSLIQEFYHPNIILMGCGGVADEQYARMAWLAVNRYFKPQAVIPMHYGALPGSSSEADIRAGVGDDARGKFMKPRAPRRCYCENRGKGHGRRVTHWTDCVRLRGLST